ncbi:outer membrane lipoprotein-sorting protein [candidate division KSB1 bacterium]|nr:outer membrane lipoprotein-sorting protein [candidate division KSB1 bacterium]
MKKIISIIVILLSASAARPQNPSGEAILIKIDANLSSRNRIVTSKMVIHGRRGSRTIEAQSWVQGIDKAFTEYLAPAREKGTKMLKLGDQLWMYSPSTDRTIQISGHMLRQSVMGSDLSYEDMMQDPKLANHYHATVEGVERIEERACWVLSLKAKTEDMAYETRKLWVDQEREIPLREDLFAKSGKLLKQMELKDIRMTEGRWYPMRMIFKDMLKTGKGTEFIVETIRFDQDIPDYLFSKAGLKK